MGKRVSLTVLLMTVSKAIELNPKLADVYSNRGECL